MLFEGSKLREVSYDMTNLVHCNIAVKIDLYSISIKPFMDVDKLVNTGAVVKSEHATPSISMKKNRQVTKCCILFTTLQLKTLF